MARDPRRPLFITFSAAPVAQLTDERTTRQVELETMAAQNIRSGPVFELFEPSMLFANGAAHRRRRAPLARAFAPQGSFLEMS